MKRGERYGKKLETHIQVGFAFVWAPIYFSIQSNQNLPVAVTFHPIQEKITIASH